MQDGKIICITEAIAEGGGKDKVCDVLCLILPVSKNVYKYIKTT